MRTAGRSLAALTAARLIGTALAAAGPRTATLPGTEWRRLYVTADHSMEVALDLARIRPLGGVVLAWVRFSYRTDQLDAHKASYRSMLQLWAYECESGRQALMQLAEFSGGAGAAGEVVASGSRHSYDWSYPEPDTLGEAAMKIACAKRAETSSEPL